MTAIVSRMGALLLFALWLLVGPAAAGERGIAPGTVLDASNAEAARDLLPPEIYQHYKKGEYANKVAAWDPSVMKMSPAFNAATKANRGRYAIGKRGTLIDAKTGKHPEHSFGYPFPEIDPKDPQAGIKVLWNYFYLWWSTGNRHNVTTLSWLGPKGEQREAVNDVYYRGFEGVAPGYAPKRNPNGLVNQFLAFTMRPSDLYGTASLGWRFQDPERRDSLWSYVPVLRRVRQVSPTNRSDGFLGSDMSQDDGRFFDGKPEDFTWKLVGTREAYRLFDPYALKHQYSYEALPGGGWRVHFRKEPMAGFQQPGWKGVAWAPRGAVLVRRPAWVIEGVPRDRYYLYGKIELWIDRETYDGMWNRKFSWKGELLNTYQVMSYAYDSPDGKAAVAFGHALYYQTAENVKLGRATFAGPPPFDMIDDAPNDFYVPLDPGMFTPQELVRLGK